MFMREQYMSMNVRPTRATAGSVLLACGAAGLLAVTGCSSGGASSSAGGSGASAAASAAATATPSSIAPSWAPALGPGVTVVPPGTAAPGHGSPDAVLAGLFLALKDKSATEYCGYAEPAVQAQCKSGLSQTPASQLPSVKNGTPGYVVIDGDKAVAGITGTMCSVGQTDCVRNSDPAAVFVTLHTFSTLWKNAITPSGAKYSLEPLTKVNGNWYIAASS
jgi:hypothetical protein